MFWAAMAPALVSAAASVGGGFMSAAGAANANAQNMAMNTQNQNFQNNVNAADWEHQQAVNQENWIHAQQMLAANQGFAREQANTAYEFNRGEAIENRHFLQNMSNTAYQRATADMRAAGINPMLAYMQGGASSGSGSQASSSGMGASGSSSVSGSSKSGSPENRFAMSNTQDELGRALGRVASSAVDTYKTGEEAKTINELRDAQKALLVKTEAGKSAEIDLTTHQTDTERERTNTERERAAYIRAETNRANSAARLAKASAIMEELRNREARPIPEGGYGRGTGIGNSFPERTLRHLEDTITDIQR